MTGRMLADTCLRLRVGSEASVGDDGGAPRGCPLDCPSVELDSCGDAETASRRAPQKPKPYPGPWVPRLVSLLCVGWQCVCAIPHSMWALTVKWHSCGGRPTLMLMLNSIARSTVRVM